MDAEQQQMGRPRPRLTSSFWLKLGLGIVILGAFAYNGGLYVHPSLHFQLSCTNSRQCVITIHHAGGGFDHGFNPAFPWTTTGDPAASAHFSPTSGTLQAYQTVQVQVTIAPGTCPKSITITSRMGIFGFSPFGSDTQTGQCTMIDPVDSTSI